MSIGQLYEQYRTERQQYRGLTDRETSEAKGLLQSIINIHSEIKQIEAAILRCTGPNIGNYPNKNLRHE